MVVMNELKIKKKEQRRLEQKRKERRKYYLLYASLILTLCMIIEPDVIRYRLALNGEITNGIIYEKEKRTPSKAGDIHKFKYKFYYEGNMYTGKSHTDAKEYREKRIGDTIKVVFLPKNPEKNDSYRAVDGSGAVFVTKFFE